MSLVRMVVGTVFVIRCVAVLACSICSNVVELLNKRGIKLTWLDKKDDLEIQEGEDNDNMQNDNLTYDNTPLVKPIKYGKCHTTNPMIWVGVLPDTLTGAVAHESAAGTLSFLNEFVLQDKMRVES